MKGCRTDAYAHRHCIHSFYPFIYPCARLVSTPMQVISLLTDYEDPKLPWSRRLPSLGANTALYAAGGFALGTACAIVPRTVEAVVKAQQKQLPPGLSPATLIRLGVVSNGTLFGLSLSLIPCAILLVRQIPLPKQISSDTRDMGGIGAAAVAGILMHQPLETRYAARGVKMHGAANFAALGLSVVGATMVQAWFNARSRKFEQEGM